MAGTLTISTLSDGTNSTSATNPIKGSAKAWVNFNGVNGAVNGSYNVSSVTVNSTGNYTVTFTNAFPNINYSVVTQGGTFSNTGPGLGAMFVNYSGTSYVAPTTTQVRMSSQNFATNTIEVSQQAMIAVFSS
jgi:hypothetical protein